MDLFDAVARIASRTLWAVLLSFVALIARPGVARGEEPTSPRLLEIANTFPNQSKIDTSRVVADIVATTSDDTEQRVLLAWGYFESLWGTWTLGDCTCWEIADGPIWGLSFKRTDCPNIKERSIANCTSFGVMQTKNPERWVSGATPAKVVGDRRLGFRVGLEVFRHAMKTTGFDVRAALRVYSSGRADWAFEKVAKRCKWIAC